MTKLSPSILAADFARLGAQVDEVEKAGADRIHVDVMEGHFVPNISMGVPVVKSLRSATCLPLETHLRISEPDLFLEPFAEAGSGSFLVHWEGKQQPASHHTQDQGTRNEVRRGHQSCHPHRSWKKFCLSWTLLS